MTGDQKDPREEAKAAWDDWTEEDRRVELEALRSAFANSQAVARDLAAKICDQSLRIAADYFVKHTEGNLRSLAILTLDALRKWAAEEDGEIPDFALDAYNAAAKVLGEKTIPAEEAP